MASSVLSSCFRLVFKHWVSNTDRGSSYITSKTGRIVDDKVLQQQGEGKSPVASPSDSG